MKKIRSIARRPLLLAAVLLPAGTLYAQDAAPTANETVIAEPAPVVTPEARAALDRMTAYIKGLQSFAIDIRSSRDEVLPYGYKLQNNESAHMIVQRPNKLRVDLDGDIAHRAYYYDGKKLTMVAPDDGVFASTGAPDTIAGVVNGLLNAGVELPLIDVLRQGFQGSLLEGVRYGLKVGETDIGGTLTDHLAFRQSAVDWQLWIGKNGQPKKILITTRYAVGDPQYQAVLDWDTRPKISAKTFVFTAPSGMREISFLTDGAATGGSSP